jgi:antibiotic biosynthesis monooxygenase (ABM) superfamily enzyme
MILRVFRARIRQGHKAEWSTLVERHSFPLLTDVPGLLGYFAGNDLGDTSGDYIMMSVWNDFDSLKRWAGANWQQAIIPEEERHLIDESSLAHYETFSPMPVGFPAPNTPMVF